MNELGDYLRRQREIRGWSQSEAADQFGVSKSYLSRTELGAIKLPSVEVRRRIAEVLGMRHLDLLVLAGELSPEEIEGAGAARNPFPASDPRHEVIERLLADNALFDMVVSMIAFADRERGVHNRK